MLQRMCKYHKPVLFSAIMQKAMDNATGCFVELSVAMLNSGISFRFRFR